MEEKRKVTIQLAVFLSLLVIIFLFFFVTVFESKYIPLLAPLHHELVKNYGLEFKHFSANRPEYWKTTIKSIQEKPLFGVGPGNFVYASKKYSTIPDYKTESSHNIFLDILVENGIFVFLIFSILIFLALKKTSNNLQSYFFLACLINFLSDYSFRIYSFSVIFIIFSGMLYNLQNKHE